MHTYNYLGNSYMRLLIKTATLLSILSFCHTSQSAQRSPTEEEIMKRSQEMVDRAKRAQAYYKAHTPVDEYVDEMIGKLEYLIFKYEKHKKDIEKSIGPVWGLYEPGHMLINKPEMLEIIAELKELSTKNSLEPDQLKEVNEVIAKAEGIIYKR